MPAPLRATDCWRAARSPSAIAVGVAATLIVLFGTPIRAQSFDSGRLATGSWSRVTGSNATPIMTALGLAIAPDQTVWQWRAVDATPGSGSYPTSVPGLFNIISVSTKAKHCLALRSDGSV